MKIAYFDCFAGAGGDMIAAAFLDAGLDSEFLKKQLSTLGLNDLRIEITETKRAGIRALRFEPIAKQQKEHRGLEQIVEIINKSQIAEAAKQTAIKIFEKLADAEAAVHGEDKDDIHFHEVGAVDSIVDIVSASIGVHFFKEKGVAEFYSSVLSVGGGTVKTAHGFLPVPAPATAILLKDIPVTAGPGRFELLTPTAAAILTSIVDEFGSLPSMKIEKIGYGAGSLNSEKFPNVLRFIIGEAAEPAQADADSVYLLETNIDDASGEVIGYVTERLLETGALDVFTTPIFMKQNRPAVKLSVICKLQDEQRIIQVLMQQGLTFGVRRQTLQRTKLTRDFTTVETKFGKIRIKTGTFNGKIVNAKPEFEDCKRAAEKHNVAVKTVIEQAMNIYKNKRKERNNK